MRSVMLWAWLAWAVLVTGCQSAPIVVHEPVTVTEYVYVRIDPKLTAKRAMPEPRNDTGAEALRVARLRKRDLQQCYADKDAIAEIQGTPVP